MKLTVGDLKNLLEGIDDDTEVRFASQPSWPFEYSIEDVQLVHLNENEAGKEDYEPEVIVYLAEGNQIGYLPGVVAEAIGWK